MATLSLDIGGPTPNPLAATNGESITITNNLGQDVILTLSPAGLLNPSNGNQLTVPTAGWTGTVGASTGTYSYIEPNVKRSPRNGTIDVG